MRDYLRINKHAYELTAPEFDDKVELRKDNSGKIVELFSPLLESRFTKARLLELGPGSGYVSRLFRERGHRVTAIEFSERMAAVVRKNAPGIELIVDEFLQHDFEGQHYQGIIAIAFIHLFQKDEVKAVLSKMRDLLDDRGLAFISTTRHEESTEGYLGKHNFRDNPLRYRKQFTKPELEALLASSGFTIVFASENSDTEVKRRWLNYIVENNS